MYYIYLWTPALHLFKSLPNTLPLVSVRSSNFIFFNAESIIYDIITKLSSPLVQQLGLWWNFKDDLEDLESIVSAIKTVLLDAEERSTSNIPVKHFLEKLKDALYDADDLLDDIHTEALRKDLLSGNKLTKEVRVFFSSSNQVTYGLKMGSKIKAIKASLSTIQNQTKLLKLVPREYPMETPFMAKRRQQTHSFVPKDKIIGRDDDKAALLKLLLEFDSEENVHITPIVGFGGLGKTALAQLIYNDEMVKNQFKLRMWVCVSDVFDVKTIVANIIKSVTNHAPDQNLEMDQLQKQLRGEINRRKYLLVLDDIWNEDRERWVSLKNLLIGGDKGSRIIITTRSHKVAKLTSKCQPHVLKGLSEDDSWSLFKDIAFEQRSADLTNSGFVEIGKQISEMCRGVPLVIKTIAGTLSFIETQNEWLSFKDNELARISQKDDEILSTLKLSYDHLPSHLKNCFAYCRLYPKDHKIVVKTLVQFWIAQGFVNQSTSSQPLEDIGFGYFKGLVERNIFQEVEEDEFRGMVCKMHDFMHDLAESVAGREGSLLNSNSSTSELDENCRHLSVDFSLIPLQKGKKLRTLLKFSNKKVVNMSDASWNWIVSDCRCLRVLELYDLNLFSVPGFIKKLKHLRYLDLSWNPHLFFIPKSICKMQNLQVLKVEFCYMLERLPKKIEKLVNLTHLSCAGCWGLTHMPSGIGKLTLLQTLSMFVVDKDGAHGAAAADLSELGGLNSLRGELIIKNLGFVTNAGDKFKAAKLKEKQHLQSLVLEWRGVISDDGKEDHDDEEKSLKDLEPHPNLKKLHLRGWRGNAKFPSWFSLLTNLVDIRIKGPSKFKHIPSFARLPHLQRLKISRLTELEYMEDNGPSGGQADSESFFPSLKLLHLKECPNMKSWWRNSPIDDDKDDDKDRTSSTMAFPCLSSLCIKNCPLSSMPLYPTVDDELILVNTSSRPLKCTIRMSSTVTTPSSSNFFVPFSKLKSFEAENIEELDHDMLEECLENMTSLKRWGIGSCSWLKSLSGLLQQMNGLTSLKIKDCKELDIEGMQWEPLKNLSGLEIDNIPQLVSLPLWLQHLDQLKTLEIQNCNGLRSLFPGFQHLTSLEKLRIIDCKELEFSADGIQKFEDYTSLRHICLESIPKCQHLPEWLQYVTNLKELHLKFLPGLTSFPDDLRCLTSLEQLHMIHISKLPNSLQITHIPRIWVDCVQVQ
ncbi:putative disease resistance protein RGA1 [Hibiscus syriacus]|uniref:putative disease resistance protein RGA1 n=1 Tax=Hibiscus syriacus TaxID=106335 RepID=UPI001921A88E|nr:putative disease resistance protein RGA1 [Hibiscus syriacus]